MKRVRVPFVTAVYEERVVVAPPTTPDPIVPKPSFECDLCGKTCDGVPAGSGLLLWFRGDEMRIDEPPLCDECSTRITMGAVSKWALEGEEEG